MDTLQMGCVSSAVHGCPSVNATYVYAVTYDRTRNSRLVALHLDLGPGTDPYVWAQVYMCGGVFVDTNIGMCVYVCVAGGGCVRACLFRTPCHDDGGGGPQSSRQGHTYEHPSGKEGRRRGRAAGPGRTAPSRAMFEASAQRLWGGLSKHARKWGEK